MTKRIGGERRQASGLALALMTSTAFTCPALAQDVIEPPARPSVDANGVDLFGGRMLLSTPGMAVGAGERTLRYRWSWYGHGWVPDQILLSRISSIVTVTIGTTADQFIVNGSTYTPRNAHGATLTYDGSVYTYTKADGTVISFGNVRSRIGGGQDAFPTQLTRPDGGRLMFDWQTATACTEYLNGEPDVCRRTRQVRRLQRVKNEANYAIVYSYATNDDNGFGYVDEPVWTRVASVHAVNLSVNPSQPIQTVAGTFSASGGFTTFTVTDPNGEQTVYRQSGYELRGIRYPGRPGEDVTIAYANNRVSSVTALGVTTTYSASDAGGVRTVTVTDGAAQPTVYTFDIASQRMKTMTNALSQTTAWLYDGSGRVTRVTNPEGDYVQLGYDTRGNVISTARHPKPTIGGPAITTTASFPASCANAAICNQPETTTDPAGAITIYKYASHGGIEKVTLPAGANGVPPETRYAYTALTSPATNQPVYELTSTSVCRTGAPGSCIGGADETRTVIAYETGNLLPVSITTQSGDGTLSSMTAFTYDAVGNRIAVDGPLNGSADTTSFRYDAGRRPIGVVSADPDGAGPLPRRAQRTVYDNAGRVSSQQVGTITGTSAADWAAFTATYRLDTSFDTNGRASVQQMIGSDGAVKSRVESTYDTLGRPKCTVLRLDPATFGSAAAANCTAGSGSFGSDRITRVHYDVLGRVERQESGVGTPAAANDFVRTFRLNGQVATLADGRGNVTTYGYDGYDRPLRTTFPDGSDEQLGYDTQGRGLVVTRRLRDKTTLGFGYDALGRPTSASVPDAGGGAGTSAYSYDNLGQLLTATDTPGHAVTLTYDGLGRRLSETSLAGSVSMQYDAAGRRTRLSWSDGFSVTYGYLVTGEVTTIREGDAGLVLGSYAYDHLGRRVTLTRGNGTVTSWGYDAASRLGSLTQDLGGTARDLVLGFTHNPAGQIATRTSSNAAYAWTGHYNVARSYAANGLNQYTQAGPVTPTYDGRGNLTSAGPRSYQYTSLNQLWHAPGATMLDHDAVGRLGYESALATLYGYDGADLVTERAYTGAAGAVPSASVGAIRRRYVHGPGVDEPLVWYEGAGTTDRRWLHQDERGSVIAVTDGTGQAIAVNSYDEHGIPAPGNMGRFQYTGQTWLPTLQMYDYKARIYSPTLGRFLQTDPIGYSDGMNMYAYVGGDAVNRKDPTGLCDDSAVDCPEIDVIAKKLHHFQWFYDWGNWGAGTPSGGVSWSLPPDVEEVVVVARRLYGPFKNVICDIPSVSFGGGVDGYLGFGGSLGGSYDFDLVNGRFGVSASVGVGVGLGIDAGPSFGAGPNGGGIVSANLAGNAGFAAPVAPGINLGAQGSYNFIGTDPGFSSVAIGRAGTPLAYANVGANVGLSTPSLYNIGC